MTENLLEALKVSGVGLITVFSVIVGLIVIIKLLSAGFPDKVSEVGLTDEVGKADGVSGAKEVGKSDRCDNIDDDVVAAIVAVVSSMTDKSVISMNISVSE